MSIFSKNLRYLRKKGNHNQDDIAILFRKKANTIGNWENQKSEPSLAELMQLGEFFKVGVEDILYTDMEKVSAPPTVHTASNIPQSVPVTSLAFGDALNKDSAKDDHSDGFWIILRELRTINERLDLLTSAVESGSFKKNSDKSYY